MTVLIRIYQKYAYHYEPVDGNTWSHQEIVLFMYTFDLNQNWKHMIPSVINLWQKLLYESPPFTIPAFRYIEQNFYCEMVMT